MQGLPTDISALGPSALIFIMIMVLFCRSLSKTLGYVSPENRAIHSGTIWLLLIPILYYVINFVVVFGMSKSIANELKSREFEEVKRPAFASGLTAATLACVLAVLQIGFLFVPVLKNYINLIGILALVQLVFFVQYWTKVNWYRRILKKDSEGEGFEEL